MKTEFRMQNSGFRFLAATMLAGILMQATSAHAVRFRLPLSSDTGVHYYYDHNTSSGVTAWNCSGTSYNGHGGTDFSGGPRGRAIFAAASGTLSYKIDGFGDGYAGSPAGGGAGNHVRINHGGGVITWYAHMTIGSVTGKAVGSGIACGEQVGGVGTSGSSTGLHLHFTLQVNGANRDPYIGGCGGLGWWVNQGSGSPSTTCEGPIRAKVSDFNGDGRTDRGLYRPSNGQWWVENVIGGTGLGGAAGDIPVSGDYNGDGRTDIGIFRPSNGQWWVENVIAGTVYGGAGDIPVPGDYNGDGRADMAIYRPSSGQWWVANVIGGTVLGGAAGDIPVPGDYNGDGRTDIGIYRPSNGQWWVHNVIAGRVLGGGSGDIPVPGDYNNDGRTDIGIFRPSNGQWWVENVIGGTVYGFSGDIPVPGDYNGDGYTEMAVFRPSTGQWWATSGINGTVFGQSGDIPTVLPAAIRNFFFGP